MSSSLLLSLAATCPSSGSYPESMRQENLKVGDDVVRVFEQFLQDKLTHVYTSQLFIQTGFEVGQKLQDPMTREA